MNGRAVHGQPNFAQEIGEGADVVLVAVREDDRAKALALGERVGEVGDDVVDPGQFVVREHQPAVDGEEVVAGLDEHHVEADLAEAAEGNEPDWGVHGTPFVAVIVASGTRRSEVSGDLLESP